MSKLNEKSKKNLVIQTATTFYLEQKSENKKIDWKAIFETSVKLVESLTPCLKDVKLTFNERSLRKYVYKQNFENNKLKLKTVINNSKDKIAGVGKINEENKEEFSPLLIRTFENSKRLVLKNYISKDLHYIVQESKMGNSFAELQAIRKTIISFLPVNESKKKVDIINWPENLKLQFSWKEFVRNYKQINDLTLTKDDCLEIQKKFFNILVTKKIFSKNNTFYINLLNYVAYDWVVSFDTQITSEMENGIQELNNDTRIRVFCSSLKVASKPWFKYELVFERKIIKDLIKNLNYRKTRSRINTLVDGVLNLLQVLYINSFGEYGFKYEMLSISLESLANFLNHNEAFESSKLSLLRTYIEGIKKIFFDLNLGYILLTDKLDKNTVVFIEVNTKCINNAFLGELECWGRTKDCKIYNLKFYLSESQIYTRLSEHIKRNNGRINTSIISETFKEELSRKSLNFNI
jgi:hypothetical protein